METTNVNMLPVCNCGQIIPDISIEMNVIRLENGLNKALIEFHPAVCPNCGKY